MEYGGIVAAICLVVLVGLLIVVVNRVYKFPDELQEMFDREAEHRDETRAWDWHEDPSWD